MVLTGVLTEAQAPHCGLPKRYHAGYLARHESARHLPAYYRRNMEGQAYAPRGLSWDRITDKGCDVLTVYVYNGATFHLQPTMVPKCSERSGGYLHERIFI